MSQDTGANRPVSPAIAGATTAKERTLLIADDDAAFRNRINPMLQEGKAKIALQMGIARDKEYPDVPTAIEIMPTQEGKQLFETSCVTCHAPSASTSCPVPDCRAGSHRCVPGARSAAGWSTPPVSCWPSAWWR